MSVPDTLQAYMSRMGVEYELVPHPFTGSSMQTAEMAHVPGDKVAKSVILEDEQGYVMVVVPATRRIELGEIHKRLQRRLALATEDELSGLFDDCLPGAIPPLGEPYGLETLVDDSLDQCNDVYFEAGNHTELVHVTGEDFRHMTAQAQHGHFSHHV